MSEQTELPPCDEILMQHGAVYTMFVPGPRGAQGVEEEVRELAKSCPDDVIDWHFVAGRAVVKIMSKLDYARKKTALLEYENNRHVEVTVDIRAGHDGWMVWVDMKPTSPTFNSKGAAEAYASAIRDGTRQPEFSTT